MHSTIMGFSRVFKHFAATGSYFYLLETNRRPLYDARLLVPFMDTTDKCLMFFYDIFGDNAADLTVSIIDVCISPPFGVGLH